MAVRKPCRSKGCKTSPRCEHPWWLDVMHNRERFVSVSDRNEPYYVWLIADPTQTFERVA